VNRTRDSVFGTRQTLSHTFLGNESEMFVGKHAFHTMFTFYTHMPTQTGTKDIDHFRYLAVYLGWTT